MQDDPNKARIAANVRKMEAAKAPIAEIEAYIRSEGLMPAPEPSPFAQVVAERSAGSVPKEPEPTMVDRLRRVGALGRQMAGGFSLGAIPALDDALTAMATSAPGTMRERFSAIRQERNRDQGLLSPGEQMAAGMVGAVASPVGAMVRAPATAGRLLRTGAAVTDAALQGGITAGVTGLDDLSREGLARAAQRAMGGAAAGVAGATGVGTGMALVRGARTIGKTVTAPTLGRSVQRMEQELAEADKALYPVARREAEVLGTSPRIQAAMEDPDVADWMNVVRSERTFRDAPDAVVLQEARKRLVEQQARKTVQVEGSPIHAAGAQARARDLREVKKVMDEALQDTPTHATAVAVHATLKQEREAFDDVAKAIDKAIHGRLGRGDTGSAKYTSPEALLEAIEKMTPNEAEAALRGLYGRSKEVWRASDDALGASVGMFGILPSTVRSALLPTRVNTYIDALERRLGPRRSFSLLMQETAPRTRAAVARSSGLLTQDK